MLVPVCLAQTPTRQAQPRIGLDTSEVIFSLMASLNSCGYDLNLDQSLPLRTAVRQEIGEKLKISADAAVAHEKLCAYFKDRQLPESSRNLAQYISLGLNLSEPPIFAPSMREADLPLDASGVLGVIPSLQKFYDAAQLHTLWMKHQHDYAEQVARMQKPVSDLILMTNIYLKLATNGYPQHPFLVFVEPLGAPGIVNARNYSEDYYMVVSPGKEPVDLTTIRHAYLHYVLDDIILKHPTGVQRLDPLVLMAKNAPLETSYKNDSSLMVVECLIKAIEIRTHEFPKGSAQKNIEAARDHALNSAMEQGYVLTRHFYEQLQGFENNSIGIATAVSDFLVAVDLSSEHKRIAGITFAAVAEQDPLRRASHMRTNTPLDLAEDRLSHGDFNSAARIARQVLDEGNEDPSRALFILAKAAVLAKRMEDARLMFERTLQVAHDSHTIAWCHIYLGRIYDYQPNPNREMAISHYRAAMNVGDSSADTKMAAEKGLSAPPDRTEKKERKDDHDL